MALKPEVVITTLLEREPQIYNTNLRFYCRPT